jgi:hypothetical protein
MSGSFRAAAEHSQLCPKKFSSTFVAFVAFCKKLPPEGLAGLHRIGAKILAREALLSNLAPLT